MILYCPCCNVKLTDEEYVSTYLHHNRFQCKNNNCNDKRYYFPIHNKNSIQKIFYYLEDFYILIDFSINETMILKRKTNINIKLKSTKILKLTDLGDIIFL